MSALLLTDIGRLVTMGDDGRVLTDSTVLARNGQIAWIGEADEPPPLYDDEVVEVLNCRGRAVLPGLVDCHTHLIFGGDRSDEFARRSAGESYESIAKEGGGIQSTVRATRNATLEQLVEAALPRLDAMLGRGVTCVEVKSGYGLDLHTEIKMLRAAAYLNEHHPITVISTFLGAHTLPQEFATRRTAYLDLVCNEMLPAVADEGLASFCDVFCEEGVFTVAETERVLRAGIDLGLRPKLHAEQLHRIGGTQLAVSMGAVSVDHLEQADAADVQALADSESTVAVLLPGATLFLGMSDWAPARELLDAGVTVALATDCNPGSCMCDDLPLMTTLGCTRLGMSPAETLRAVTSGAAAALGLAEERGRLSVGCAADFWVPDVMDEAQIPYRFGRVGSFAVVAGGRVLVGPGRNSR
jgi:imidazolonepropionase